MSTSSGNEPEQPSRRGRSRDSAPGPELDRSVCTPCRGTGKVISGLGGTPHEVTCPWCGGSGRFVPGANAQNIGSSP